MDLKRVQDDLKNDIYHHQMLMQMLKKDPLNQALKLKLKAIQQHIAELGSKQKQIIGNLKNTPGPNKPKTPEDEKTSVTPQSSNQPINRGLSLAKPSTSMQNHLLKSSEEKPPSKYTLITIKNGGARPVQANPSQSDNMPINLSCVPVKSNANEKPFVSSSAVLVVTSSSSQNAISHKSAIRPSAPTVSVPLSISLSSLVSTGGVVTLASGWKGPSQPKSGSKNNNNAATDNFGRMLPVPTKQLQIKVPVVQTSGSNPVIVMQQQPSSSQAKSFRLLPKGRRPIPVRNALVNGAQKFTIPNHQGHQMAGLSLISPKQSNTVLLSNEGPIKKAQPYQQMVVHRLENKQASIASSAPASTSVTWQDLSSKTPAIHKPSYVPRKSFPNINNGVGSFQKFRILDGKPQILPKSNQENPASPQANSSVILPGGDKPKNAALKALLTSSKPSTTSAGTVTYARLLPTTIPKNGFYPIQPKGSNLTSSIPQQRHIPASGNSFKPFTADMSSSSVSGSNFKPLDFSDSPAASPISFQEKVGDETSRGKAAFLRNIDLVPREQADKLRSRRFRKRRVAANPVYSGGMYITNEIESKRQCTEGLIGNLEGITPPDVIVKRPRGRPRGSTKLAQANLLHQSSGRGVRSSAPSPVQHAHMEEVRQLRGILDIVASASKAVSSAGLGLKEERSKKQPVASTSPQTTQGTRTGSVPAVKELKDEEVDEHEDQCASCGRTGEVLMCDTCSRVYHLSCTTPPLDTVPQGMWICSKCKTEFKKSKSKSKWPGIVSVVHSYMEHDEQREIDIENEQDKLNEAKKIISGLQMQTKTLTSAVMSKVNVRSKAMKEKQNMQKELTDFRNLVQSVWDIAVKNKNTSS